MLPLLPSRRVERRNRFQNIFIYNKNEMRLSKEYLKKQVAHIVYFKYQGALVQSLAWYLTA